MVRNHVQRLHWKLFFPLVGLLWLIIGILITYFVVHERQRQKENLENRLLNVNNTVVEAYERGVDLGKTVDFIKLFTDHTTLDPLRITVYDDNGGMVADNQAATITIHDENGQLRPELYELWNGSGSAAVRDLSYDGDKSMISSRMSHDGKIHSFAALPYEGEVLDFLSTDSTVWAVVIFLGLLSSVLAYFGVRAVSRNVYSLRDFAQSVANDDIPDDVATWRFSNDELGDVSRTLVTLYRDKIHAEQEKLHFEHQIGINVSHELNTPVSIIKGYIDTVLDGDEMPAEVKTRFLKRIQQNTDRLANLVNDVGMVMRLGENSGTITGEKLDFQALVCRISEDVGQGHIANNMKFSYDIPSDCNVMAHESLLTNALLNLVYNSARHSGGSEMSVKWIRCDGTMHYFSFSDNGRGVDPEHVGRLFDMFYRVDPGRTRKHGGSGLGLPLVRRIIVAMGGSIDVENIPTGGLEFTFSLPAAMD